MHGHHSAVDVFNQHFFIALDLATNIQNRHVNFLGILHFPKIIKQVELVWVEIITMTVSSSPLPNDIQLYVFWNEYLRN